MVMSRLRFTVFSDFHYQNEMNGVKVEDLEKILERAENTNSDFVIHCGDFCQAGIESNQIFKAYLENEQGLKVYGVYGNHELEGSLMPFTTPRLTNDREVIWGTEDGKIGNGYIGHYYFDINGYRIVCTNTNYSYNEAEDIWEHNKRFSWGPPSENVLYNALSPNQLEWLEDVLNDAADKDLKCIIFSHSTFSPLWRSDCSDAQKVRDIFARVNAKKPKTVIAALNGHYHTNHMGMVDGIFYFDVNSNRGHWQPNKIRHLDESHTFEYTEYNCFGEKVRSYQKQHLDYYMADNGWFFADKDLSAVVTIDGDEIMVDGFESEWYEGIVPEKAIEGTEPRISSGTFKIG